MDLHQFSSETIRSISSQNMSIIEKGFQERNCFLLVGGDIKDNASDNAYILDFDKRKSYAVRYQSY